MAKTETVVGTKFKISDVPGIQALLDDSQDAKMDAMLGGDAEADDARFDGDWSQIANLAIAAGKLPKDFSCKSFGLRGSRSAGTLEVVALDS